jgi:hypothetical protein
LEVKVGKVNFDLRPVRFRVKDLILLNVCFKRKNLLKIVTTVGREGRGFLVLEGNR